MILSGIDALLQTSRLRKGKLAKLSIAQITNLIINLPDAKRNLDPESFENVYQVYKGLQLCKIKKSMTSGEYISTATCIVKLFHSQAPYEKYSGADPAETAMMLKEIENAKEFEREDFLRFSERVRLETERTKRSRRLRRIAVSSFILVFGFFLTSHYVRLAISEKYSTGYDNGYDDGYSSGYQAGFDAGILAEEYVYCSDTTRTYHWKDCVLGTKLCYEKTIDQAKDMGYSACTVCIGKEVYEAYEKGHSEGYKSGLEHAKLYYGIFGS